MGAGGRTRIRRSLSEQVRLAAPAGTEYLIKEKQ